MMDKKINDRKQNRDQRKSAKSPPKSETKPPDERRVRKRKSAKETSSTDQDIEKESKRKKKEESDSVLKKDDLWSVYTPHEKTTVAGIESRCPSSPWNPDKIFDMTSPHPHAKQKPSGKRVKRGLKTDDVPKRNVNHISDINANNSFDTATGCSSHDVQQNSRELSNEEISNIMSEMTTYFTDTTQYLNTNYENQVMVYCCNKFCFTVESHIKRILKQHSHRLTAILDSVENGNLEKGDKSQSRSVKACPFPKDATFDFEMKFLKARKSPPESLNSDDITQLYDEFCKISNKFWTCRRCDGTRFLKTDMMFCVIGHSFCRKCIVDNIKLDLERNRLQFPCLEKNCVRRYSLHRMELVLNSQLFASVLAKLEVYKITTLVTSETVKCPFYHWLMLSKPCSDSLLVCTNTGCAKISCRLCRKRNHWPHRCYET